jgi:hypothetical protein
MSGGNHGRRLPTDARTECTFSDAEAVLPDPQAVTVEDERAGGQQRLVTVGSDGVGCILVAAIPGTVTLWPAVSSKKQGAAS